MHTYALSAECPGGQALDVRADILRRPRHVREVSALPDPTRPDPTRNSCAYVPAHRSKTFLCKQQSVTRKSDACEDER